MKIQTAKHMGLCFGVKDAIKLAETSAKNGPTTILGPLAHNPAIQRRLQDQRIGFVQHPQEAITRELIITAHGVSNRTRVEVHQAGFDVKDATCPLVHFAHRSLLQLVEEGYYPVVIGKAGHIEVRGLTGDLDAFTIVLSESDIMNIPQQDRIGIISQTTQPIDKVRLLVARIKERFPEAEVQFKDTVCHPTKQRQSAAVALGKSSDVVVVIGGRTSNNTRQLSETISNYCTRVHQIESITDLKQHWFCDSDTVGVTAGTSTPDETVKPILRQLEAWAAEWDPKDQDTALHAMAAGPARQNY